MDYRASEYLVPIFDFDVLHLQLNTPIYIFVLVVIVMFFLNKFLFQPVLNTLDTRKAYLNGLQETVEKQQAEIADLTEQYETKLEAAKNEVAELRKEARKSTQDSIDAILSKARQEADTDLQAALGELSKDVETARQALADSAKTLAEQTTTRILS